MFSAANIHYEIADRARGLAYGGIGAMHLLARETGLAKAIDQKLKLLKLHLPYHESDHVLNIAYNILCNGDCLEDIERLRTDEVYLDALGAEKDEDDSIKIRTLGRPLARILNPCRKLNLDIVSPG